MLLIHVALDAVKASSYVISRRCYVIEHGILLCSLTVGEYVDEALRNDTNMTSISVPQNKACRSTSHVKISHEVIQ